MTTVSAIIWEEMDKNRHTGAMGSILVGPRKQGRKHVFEHSSDPKLYSEEDCRMN